MLSAVFIVHSYSGKHDCHSSLTLKTPFTTNLVSPSGLPGLGFWLFVIDIKGGRRCSYHLRWQHPGGSFENHKIPFCQLVLVGSAGHITLDHCACCTTAQSIPVAFNDAIIAGGCTDGTAGKNNVQICGAGLLDFNNWRTTWFMWQCWHKTPQNWEGSSQYVRHAMQDNVRTAKQQRTAQQYSRHKADGEFGI